MSIADLIRRMSEAGASPEAIAIAVGFIEEAIAKKDSEIDARKAVERDRTRRYRERGGGNVSPDVRASVMLRDGGVCQDCGTTEHLEIDHIHPVSLGGSSDEGNLQVLCKVCNSRKKDRIRKSIPRNSAENDTPPSSPIPLDPPSQTLPPIIPQSPSSTEPQKRARRLADDWVLPSSWGRWALDEGWPEATIRIQADMFGDFWRSKAGKDAAKLDWEATWRNWMRKVPKTAQRLGGQQRERTILDVIDERLERDNDIFSALRTIDVEPARREPSPPDLRLVADASRH